MTTPKIKTCRLCGREVDVYADDFVMQPSLYDDEGVEYEHKRDCPDQFDDEIAHADYLVDAFADEELKKCQS